MARAPRRTSRRRISEPRQRSTTRHPRFARGFDARTHLLKWMAIGCVRLHCMVDHGLKRWFGWPFDEPFEDQPEIERIREEIDRIEPDASMGPVITREDAPRLFRMLVELARSLGTRSPREVRLSYLPACGVLEFSVRPGIRRPVLVLGLPALHVLSIDEMKSVLAHELAHLRHEDIDFQNRAIGWARNMRSRLERMPAEARSFVRVKWAWWNCRWVERLARPVTRAMEFRADAFSADACGSGVLARALEKLAVVQPVFAEVLSSTDPRLAANVYRRFASVWKRLDGDTYEQLRKRLVEEVQPDEEDSHPTVSQRIDRLSGGKHGSEQYSPSLHLLNDPVRLEELLHNHLFQASDARPTVFRPALLNRRPRPPIVGE